ncbi:MAG: DUF499 domain-containing protein [Planctomycetota bacterium]|nr:DUF499 domain-containing protein [Planctomycetota bacterium]
MPLGSLKDLCVPRKSVFDKARRDVVLDLSDLLDGKIKPQQFFEENYLTEGMKVLFRESFRRFNGESDQGVYVLTQAMGGGKTHNMLGMGLLAKHPDWRKKVFPELAKVEKLGPVRVIGFTGRDTDAPLGIWGSLAEQLGKKDLFKDYYSPLAAPGPSAWVNLLKGEPLLILLDELPPYFQYAKSRQIGNSDLAEVTTTALANLLVAVAKADLQNVCVVVSDLKATYEQGSELVNKALKNFGEEVGRQALKLEPVALNTNEVYDILRTRIFEKLPAKKDVQEIAKAYAESVRTAKQMDITNASPEQFAQNIVESYPFHFAIKDLYARFRENPGFQQTRGLIRLMRVLAGYLYKTKKADKLHLIHAQDFDLNDPDTFSEFTQINPSLANAISHDIASKGQAVAEEMDAQTQSTDAQDVCKLLVASSLANVPNATLGLSIPEAISFLCAPGRDVTKLKETLSLIQTKAWYLHPTRDGKLYFKNVENLVAKLKSTADNYNRETVLRELRSFLASIFTPNQKDCYQDVLALPGLDEVKPRQDRVTLLICEPNRIGQGGLSTEWRKFYEDLDYKNRILLLTGTRGSLESLINSAREYKAIQWIVEEMEKEKVPQNDPQYINGTQLRDKISLSLLSAARETFTILHYPSKVGLVNADFEMKYAGNQYNGEEQVRNTLESKFKFTKDVGGDNFRQQCEAKLFTTKRMRWEDIKKRAAVDPSWPWHLPDALDRLRDDMIHKEQWKKEGEQWVEKGPFPKPKPSVRWQELERNDDTGEVTLKLTPVNGDTVHYEIGGNATSASAKVSDLRTFKTTDLELSFLAAEDASEYGEPVTWRNRITLKARQFQNGKDKMVELRAAPTAEIRYTTDGSHPSQGALYAGPFIVPKENHRGSGGSPEARHSFGNPERSDRLGKGQRGCRRQATSGNLETAAISQDHPRVLWPADAAVQT